MYALGPGREIIDIYVAEGKVRYGTIQNPILGDASVRAAIASESAAEQGSFWQYHDALYEESSDQGSALFLREALLELAAEVGLNGKVFESCFVSGRANDRLESDRDSAKSLGVESVPTIFINDERFIGDRTFEGLSAKIEQAFAR